MNAETAPVRAVCQGGSLALTMAATITLEARESSMIALIPIVLFWGGFVMYAFSSSSGNGWS